MSQSIHIFRSKKSKSFRNFLIITSILVTFLTIGLPLILAEQGRLQDNWIGCLIVCALIAFFVWIWRRTYYVIEDNKLKLISGPFRWHISILDIKTIHLNQNTINGLIKLSLSWKCMEIHYRKYSSVSISPENQDRFIDMLTSVNGQIIIKR